VTVVAGDALRVPLPDEPHLVVSNAPYAIGTRLTRRLLTEAHGLTRAALVLQREAARRLAGRPACGRFAATWAPWFAISTGRTVPARAFRPPPAVASAIVTLAPRQAPLLSPAAFRDYDAFLAAVFGGRGRTVAERLRRHGAGRRGAQRMLAAAGVDAAATPSQVAPERYARLFAAYRRARGATLNAPRMKGWTRQK
jgi:23S rRNA (adenine-N6)-dimethyltransferase